MYRPVGEVGRVEGALEADAATDLQELVVPVRWGCATGAARSLQVRIFYNLIATRLFPHSQRTWAEWHDIQNRASQAP